MSAVKKIKIERDRFTEDGVRLCNLTKPHGVVYADGYFETKYIQDYEGKEVHYKGDLAPVGYKKGVPMPPSADELIEENSALHNRIRDLEDSQRRTEELLERLSAQLASQAQPPPTPAPKVAEGSPEVEAVQTFGGGAAKATEASARGAQKTK